MTSWTDKFTALAVPGVDRSLAVYAMSSNLVLDWPTPAAGTIAPIASIVELTASVSSLTVTLPAANGASVAAGALFINKGSPTITILNSAGTTITTLVAGDSKSIYTTDNSSAAGVWSVVSLGVSTSAPGAGTLAGPGLKAIGATLGVASTVVETTANTTLTTANRGKTYVLTSGSATFTLPTLASATTDLYYFFRNSGLGTLTLDGSGAELVDGAATKALAPGESCFLVSGSAGWYSVGWGRSVDFNFTQLVKDVTAGGTFTLTAAEAANKLIQLTATAGFPTVATTIVLPSTASVYYVYVAYTGVATATFKTALAAGVPITAGARSILYCDGTNVVVAQSITAGTTISVVDGTVAVPAVNFTGEASTGIYRIGAGILGFSLLGVEALRIDATNATFTKIPLGPTAAPGTNTTQLATTAFVQAAAVGGAPLLSPAFTGTPTAPTAAPDTNTTQIATTAFVLGQRGTATPLGFTTAGTSGTSYRYAPQDHVHPANITAGNMTFSSTSQRILGDFTNGSQDLRLSFQTSTANSNTNIQTLPSGTGTSSNWQTSNAADALNCSLATFGIDGTRTLITSQKRGTGTYLPMVFQTNGADQISITTAGALSFMTTAQRITGDMSNATINNRLFFQTSTANSVTVVSAMPSGTGLNSFMLCSNSSDTANFGCLSFGCDTTSAQINSSKVGAGTYIPLVLQTGGATRQTISTAGIFTFNTGSAVAGINYNFSGPGVFCANSSAVALGVGYDETRRAAGQVVYLGANNSATPKLIISNAAGTAIASIDNSGNAIFLGDVTAFGTP